jgi:hypothetical protein
VGRESYGFGRCSVLAITGIFKFLLPQNNERIGRAHANPMFDTREYEIEFTDGTHEKYQANIIAKNMFGQVDSEGNQFLLLQEITDHKRITAQFLFLME